MGGMLATLKDIGDGNQKVGNYGDINVNDVNDPTEPIQMIIDTITIPLMVIDNNFIIEDYSNKFHPKWRDDEELLNSTETQK